MYTPGGFYNVDVEEQKGMGERKQSAQPEPDRKSRLHYISKIGIGAPLFVLRPGKREIRETSEQTSRIKIAG